MSQLSLPEILRMQALTNARGGGEPYHGLPAPQPFQPSTAEVFGMGCVECGGTCGDGMAGLGASSDVPASVKADFTKAVSDLEDDHEGGHPHENIRARAEMLRDSLMSMPGWSDRSGLGLVSSSWEWFTGPFEPSRELLARINAVHVKSAVAAGRIPAAMTERRDPMVEATKEFARDVQRRAASGWSQAPGWAVKLGLGLGALYLAGKFIEARWGRR